MTVNDDPSGGSPGPTASSPVSPGRVAVVTGAASGIGLGLAERFAAERMHVVLADVEEPALAKAAAELAGAGASVLPVVTDVSDRAAVDALRDAALSAFGAVHVVCNNAGVGGHGYPTDETPLVEWEWVLGVNLWGVIHGVKTFLPVLLEQNEGHVVNTASVAGLISMPFMAPYAVAKHGVVALSEAIWHELSFRGSAVGVTVLCPGWVNTRIMDSTRNWLGRLGEEPTPSADAGWAGGEQLVRGVVANGAPPSVAADDVLECIRSGRFMAHTAPEMAKQLAANRMAEVEGAAPSMPALF
jgi:NAD(P)-dependent dehydrogenase (short-subunit alcohol dehydrogenase family)